MAKIVHVDTDIGWRNMLATALRAAGHTVQFAQPTLITPEFLRSSEFDLLICGDPSHDSLRLIRGLREADVSIATVLARSGDELCEKELATLRIHCVIKGMFYRFISEISEDLRHQEGTSVMS